MGNQAISWSEFSARETAGRYASGEHVKSAYGYITANEMRRECI